MERPNVTRDFTWNIRRSAGEDISDAGE